jgi:glycosyltransferase involved in cell wall biosynthesis
MLAADVHVCLRRPTMGETSAVAVRAVSAGKPLVVDDVGWFSELPETVALKVSCEPESLTAALEELAGNPQQRARMGAASLELARTEHDLNHVADLYAAALEEALPSRRRELVRQA